MQDPLAATKSPTAVIKYKDFDPSFPDVRADVVDSQYPKVPIKRIWFPGSLDFSENDPDEIFQNTMSYFCFWLFSDGKRGGREHTGSREFGKQYLQDTFLISLTNADHFIADYRYSHDNGTFRAFTRSLEGVDSNDLMKAAVFEKIIGANASNKKLAKGSTISGRAVKVGKPCITIMCTDTKSLLLVPALEPKPSVINCDFCVEESDRLNFRQTPEAHVRSFGLKNITIQAAKCWKDWEFDKSSPDMVCLAIVAGKEYFLASDDQSISFEKSPVGDNLKQYALKPGSLT